MILESRLKHVGTASEATKSARADTWKALEKAQAGGKCRYIGVSNYTPNLIKEMEAHATVMPCINQLELHPRFASPQLMTMAKQTGMVLTGYGTGNSVCIEQHQAIREISEKHNTNPVSVVLKWTAARGVCVVPRSKSEEHIKQNYAAIEGSGFELDEADMAALDAMDEAHPYYWSPVPFLPLEMRK